MRLKGKFSKQELHVGLSAELPLGYRGAEEKYTLADILALSTPTHIRFEKKTVEFELVGTSIDLGETPDRVRCYQLVSVMPEAALSEVVEELRETYQHYISLAATPKAHQLPAPSRSTVTATVIEHVKT